MLGWASKGAQPWRRSSASRQKIPAAATAADDGPPRGRASLGLAHDDRWNHRHHHTEQDIQAASRDESLQGRQRPEELGGKVPLLSDVYRVLGRRPLGGPWGLPRRVFVGSDLVSSVDGGVHLFGMVLVHPPDTRKTQRDLGVVTKDQTISAQSKKDERRW